MTGTILAAAIAGALIGWGAHGAYATFAYRVTRRREARDETGS